MNDKISGPFAGLLWFLKPNPETKKPAAPLPKDETTPHKPHNGVLLDDIRDWIQHPKINKTTDLYSYDVLVFWMLTFLHPFRGEYPICKTLEERVCKKPDWLNTHTQLIG